MRLSRNRMLLLVQGSYYLITGLWPLVNVRSFEAVTGPKSDKFVLRSIAILITAIGAVLLFAAGQKRPTPVSTALGSASALSLASMEVLHAKKIKPIYLADTVAELILGGGLLISRSRVEN